MADPQFVSAPASSARSRFSSEIALTGGLAFISGQLPIDLENDRTPLPELIEDQTAKILSNLLVLLGSVGIARENIASVRVSLVDLPRLYERMNNAYVKFFSAGPLPARACVGVSCLPRGALVQMDFIVTR